MPEELKNKILEEMKKYRDDVSSMMQDYEKDVYKKDQHQFEVDSYSLMNAYLVLYRDVEELLNK